MRERKSPILLKTIWEKRREENVTAMMAIRREIIDIVGKFDPFFNVRGEDRDFLLRVKMHNISLVFNKTAIVFHKKKSFKPRDYWRMRIPRARTSIKFGLYVWRDTAAVVFHFLSLVQLLVLWLIGELLLGLFLFTQSLLLRIRNSLKFFRDKEHERLVTAMLYAYIAYTAFIAEFLRYHSSNFGYFLIRKNQKNQRHIIKVLQDPPISEFR
jgi:GT2 family glycosyltransferase